LQTYTTSQAAFTCSNSLRQMQKSTSLLSQASGSTQPSLPGTKKTRHQASPWR